MYHPFPDFSFWLRDKIWMWPGNEATGERLTLEVLLLGVVYNHCTELVNAMLNITFNKISLLAECNWRQKKYIILSMITNYTKTSAVCANIVKNKM